MEIDNARVKETFGEERDGIMEHVYVRETEMGRWGERYTMSVL